MVLHSKFFIFPAYLEKMWKHQLEKYLDTLNLPDEVRKRKKAVAEFDAKILGEKFKYRVSDEIMDAYWVVVFHLFGLFQIRHMKDTLRANLAARLGVPLWFKNAFKNRIIEKFVNGKCGINMELKKDPEDGDSEDGESDGGDGKVF